MPNVLTIDGSYGEGGGQILRTTLALAAITGQAVQVERIRVGRSKPGLRPQHLTAVLAAADICAAQLNGAQVNSRTLHFAPTAAPQAGEYRWQIGTAGSVSLVFQAVLLPLALCNTESTITLTGGTHVNWSPPVDYVQQVYLPLLDSLGIRARIEIERCGWNPKGGGVIHAHIAGHARPHGLDLCERGSLRQVSVRSIVSNLPEHINQRQAQRADFLLRKQGIKAQVEQAAPPSPGQGTAVFILADYQHATAGFTAYGRIRKPAEKVAEEAAKALIRYHKRQHPVDEHLADQILLPLSIAATAQHGAHKSQYATESVTRHLLTNAWVIEQFLDIQIAIDGSEKRPGTVTISPRA